MKRLLLFIILLMGLVFSFWLIFGREQKPCVHYIGKFFWCGGEKASAPSYRFISNPEAYQDDYREDKQ